LDADDSLPDDVITARSIVLSERTARLAAEATARTLLVEKLKLTIKKLRHEEFGRSSECGALLDQLELQLADIEESATQAETEAQMAAARRLRCPCSRAASRPQRKSIYAEIAGRRQFRQRVDQARRPSALNRRSNKSKMPPCSS
jgi:transposase